MAEIIKIQDGSTDVWPINMESIPGYLKLPDGTLIQWGKAGGYSGSNAATTKVTLPLPYLNYGSYTAYATGTLGGTDYGNYEVICVARVDTKDTIYVHQRNTTSNYLNSFFWLTIGRWK